LADAVKLRQSLGEFWHDAGTGLAKAYDLQGATADPFSYELRELPALDSPEEDFRTYFYPTRKGMELHQSETI
jgi:hypothetical protein